MLPTNKDQNKGIEIQPKHNVFAWNMLEIGH